MERKIASAFRLLAGVEEKRPEAVEFEGDKWIVGEVKKDSIYPLGLRDLVRFYPLVVKWVLERELKRGDIKEVGISLPTETWWKEVSTGEERVIKEVKERIEAEVGVKAIVYPQGVSALKVLPELQKGVRTLIIDGGFNTVNLAVVDEKGYLSFVKTIYNEFGIRDLLENYFRPEVERVYPSVSTNLQYLKEIFLEGKLDLGFEEVSLQTEKQKAVKKFITKLFDRIKGELERAGERFRQFAIVGGLTHYLPPKINTTKKHFVGDEFSTVRGIASSVKSGIGIDFGFGDIKVAVREPKAGTKA